jgi:hypothetical protein
MTRPERDPDVRREAAIALLTWKKQYPWIANVLAELGKSDPDARVREVALEARKG